MSTLWDKAVSTKEGFREIGPREVHENRDLRCIDVREPEEFVGELGHIPGAELVPLDTVEGAQRDWDRSEMLVVVCRSGGRSGKAAGLLVRAGCSNMPRWDYPLHEKAGGN